MFGFKNLMLNWKKIPVLTKSTPGFIVNRIARPFYAEGFRALQEQVTSYDQLDYALKQCGGFAMGPCELTDLIGQDVNFSVTQSVYQEFFYEPRYRPSLVQKNWSMQVLGGVSQNKAFIPITKKINTRHFSLKLWLPNQSMPIFS